MKYKLFLTTAAILLAAVVLFQSCRRDNILGPKGSFTLKGRLIQSCDGPPLGGRELTVTYSNDNAFNPVYKYIGTGTTDAEGYFEINCENNGQGSIDLVQFVGSVDIIKFVEDYEISSGNNGTTIDMGTVYDYITTTALINLHFSGSYLPTDTFIIGYLSDDALRISPIPNDTLLTFSSNTSGVPLNHKMFGVLLYHGIGQNDYDSSKNYGLIHGMGVPQYNQILISTSMPCATIDTSINF